MNWILQPVIRNAYIEDVQDIQKINSSAFGYEYGLEETKNRIFCILKKPNDVIFVAEADNCAVGYIHGSDYDCTYSPPLKNILTLGVLEEYRGRGIGRLLIERLEEWAKEDKCAGVRLVSGFNRADAHNFYLHCGYTDRKDQKNFIKLFTN